MPLESNAVLSLDVRKSYADFALSVRTDIALDGVTGLFGASGSGKSTLLRVIAGFEKDVAGTARMADKVWLNSAAGEFVPAYQRQIGYVFQDARLFEHLDVAGNLHFADRRNRGVGPGFAEVVAALDLEPLLNRTVTRLSGGERQRVALGRTLLSRPALMLLDEPLAALDSARKQEILPYLESLRTRFGIPTVYVSHAVDEIVRLADRVVVLQDGKVAAAGETAAVLDALPVGSVGLDAGIATVFEAQVVRHIAELHLTELAFCGQPLFVPSLSTRQPGEQVVLRVRASDVALALGRPTGLSMRNVFKGTVQRVAEQSNGAFALVTVQVGTVSLRAEVTRHALQAMQLVVGMELFALLKTATFASRRWSADESL
ncbi:molybdenum ABC transporter ATP-binding protein [Woeseia oceani]|uniref:Molybdenum ABC transporter ATP-binding protein n=1 Tax=Woeseia oceani TaxID=1548547 RepID=A0A193LL84_9GAMM|nr:molybdenum ABC transporter ATP-binding protein [Woeseia oceani]ANO53247.1 molybdenum ABC transporter ATP-binding protein [Woeseia oceani]